MKSVVPIITSLLSKEIRNPIIAARTLERALPFLEKETEEQIEWNFGYSDERADNLVNLWYKTKEKIIELVESKEEKERVKNIYYGDREINKKEEWLDDLLSSLRRKEKRFKPV